MLPTCKDTAASVHYLPRAFQAPGSKPAADDRGARVPVYVVGGFLGSGKTTLLRRLVRHVVASGARPAVLIHEHAELSFAADLLGDQMSPGAFELRSVLAPCVCCDPADVMAAEVGAMLREAAGPILVETTGLAHLGRAAAAVAKTIKRGRRRAHLAGIIAVVDAHAFDDPQLRHYDLAADVAAADIVVINKVDGIAAKALELIEAFVRVHNPTARIFQGAFAEVAVSELLESTRPDIAGDLLEASRAPRLYGVLAADERLEKVTANLLGPVDVERMARVFARHESSLLRVKGILRASGTWGVQEVQWLPGTLDVRLRSKAKSVRAHLSIIGRNVDWERFSLDLDRCVRTERPSSRRTA